MVQYIYNGGGNMEEQVERLIDYLIENQIALQDLGHLQLNSEILMKIYNKDNRCKEALQTVQNRKY